MVVCDGAPYDVPQGLCFSLPVRCEGGEWKPVVDDITLPAAMQVIASCGHRDLICP